MWNKQALTHGKGWVNRVVVGLILLGFILGSPPVFANELPQEVIRETTVQLLETMEAKREDIERNPDLLYKLVEEILLPVIDTRRVSRWILGRYGRSATPEQLARFTRELQTMLIHTYSNPLLEYTDIEIDYLPQEIDPNAENAVVRTRIKQTGREPLPVYYHLHFKDGDWKIYDVTVAGVSAVVTLRSTFSEEIRKLGLEGFIEKLAQHNKRHKSLLSAES